MATDWSRFTDVGLADEAQQGLRGQGATVEMMRRLREATTKQQEAMNTLTKWIVGLTVTLVALTVVQVAVIVTEFVN